MPILYIVFVDGLRKEKIKTNSYKSLIHVTESDTLTYTNQGTNKICTNQTYTIK